MRPEFNYDPEMFEAYVAACKMLEKGAPRIQVLTKDLVRLVCWGGKRNILPAVYIKNVPKDVVDMFRLTKDDDKMVAAYLSDKPELFAKVVNDIPLREEEKKIVYEDILPELEEIARKTEDIKPRTMLEKTIIKIRRLLSKKQ